MARLTTDQRAADERLSEVQRGLAAAKETFVELNHNAGEARAAHAGLVERATALAGEVTRLREAARELEERISARSDEIAQMQARREELLQSIANGERTLDESIRALDALRDELRTADEAAGALRAAVAAQDAVIRDARQLLEGIRSQVSSLDIAVRPRSAASAKVAELSVVA